MQPVNNVSANVVTTQYLSDLDRAQLVDLLHHRTHLLVTARITRIQDQVYLKTLQNEVEIIQAAIKACDADPGCA